MDAGDDQHQLSGLDKLYGRETEIEQVTAAFDRMIQVEDQPSNDAGIRRKSSRPRQRRGELVLIEGSAGTGKSSLVETAWRDKVSRHKHKGFMVRGKFDQILSTQPFGALIEAFSDLCEQILESEKGFEIVHALIEPHKVPQLHMLTTLIPNLKTLLTTLIPDLKTLLTEQSIITKQDNESDHIHQSETYPLIRAISPFSSDSSADRENENESGFGRHRLKFAFRDFCLVIAECECPLVLFFDDLQWADASTLNIIQFLVMSSNVNQSPASWLIVGAYRPYPELLSLSVVDPLNLFLRDMEAFTISQDNISAQSDYTMETTPRITRIELGNLSPEAIEELVVAVTKYNPVNKCRQLAGALCRNRNPFLVVESLKLFRNRSLLFYSRSKRLWEWNIQKIKENILNQENVARDRFANLPKETINVLTVASCLGSRFDVILVSALMQRFYPENKPSYTAENLQKILLVAVREGMIGALTDGQIATHQFKFSHDCFHQSAYDWVDPQRPRIRMHYEIGQFLTSKDAIMTSEAARSPLISLPDSRLLMAAQQFNEASEIIQAPEEFLDVAKINYEAANIAKKQGAFGPAAELLRRALNFLARRGQEWEGDYSETLKVVSMLAHMEYCNGHFDQCEARIDLVFNKARTRKEKMPLYILQMELYGAQKWNKEAIKIGVDRLHDLGDPFPDSPTLLNVVFSYFITKHRLRSWNERTLLEMVGTSNNEHLTAMDIMSRGVVFAYYAVDQIRLPLFALRMMTSTLMYGASKFTAQAFGLYGYFSCVRGDLKTAHKYCHLALKMMERFPSNEIRLRTYPTLFLVLHHLQRPVNESIQPILTSYRLGMQSGSILDAAMCVVSYFLIYLFCGRPLDQLHESIRGWGSITGKEKKQLLTQSLIEVYDQAIQRLVRPESSSSMTAQQQRQQQLQQQQQLRRHRLRNRRSSSDSIVQQTEWFINLMVATFLNEAREVERLAEYISQETNLVQGGSNIYVGPVALYRGLAALQGWRKNKSLVEGWRYRFRFYLRKSELQGYVNQGWGFANHMLLLLQAEEMSVKYPRRIKRVRVAFDKAIQACHIDYGNARGDIKHEHYIYHEALANERFARFLQSRRLVVRRRSSEPYWKRAHYLYTLWGALRKVEKLEDEHSFLRQGRPIHGPSLSTTSR